MEGGHWPQGHPQMFEGWVAQVWKELSCVVYPQGLPRQRWLVLEAGTRGFLGNSLQVERQ